MKQELMEMVQVTVPFIFYFDEICKIKELGPFYMHFYMHILFNIPVKNACNAISPSFIRLHQY